MSFYDNFLRLCAERGETPSGAAGAIGLSNAAATGWKKGKTPSDLTLAKLAEHFQCAPWELSWDREAFSENLVRIMAESGKGIQAFAAELDVPAERVRSWLSRAAVPKRGEILAVSRRWGYRADSLDKRLEADEGPAAPAREGLRLEQVCAWIRAAEKEELLSLMPVIAERLKEL